MHWQNKPQAFEVNNTEGRAYWGMGILWTMLATRAKKSGGDKDRDKFSIRDRDQ